MIPFPEVVDSSFFATFRSCERKAELEYLLHWKPRTQSVHLHAGAAFAKGLEETRLAYYEKGLHPDDALAAGSQALVEAYGDFECPPESAKSLERMLGALVYYFDAFPLETDKARPIVLPGGKLGIEFSFVEPLDFLHPVTGNPVLYAGRLDLICEFDGLVMGEDDKTTSQLGASWPRQWDLRSQFTSYVWGTGRHGIKLDGFLVRGVSILKTKYDHAAAITYRPQWMVDRWYEQTLKDMARLQRAWESGYYDYNLDHACQEYGGCLFRNVCQMREPTPLLESHFEQRRWDPVTRTEILLGTR